MIRSLSGFVLLFALVPSLAGQTRPPRGPLLETLEDIWNSAYLEGSQAGYVRTTIASFTQDGKRILRGTTELNLTLKRNSDTIQLRMENGTDETEDGKVIGVFMRQYLGKQQQLNLAGVLDGKEMHVKVDGGQRLERRIPWNDTVIGVYGQERLFKRKQAKPGDVIRYLSYESTNNAIVGVTAYVKDFEVVDIKKQRRKLLRVDAVPDKIEAGNGEVQLPTMSAWLDENYQTVKSEFDMQPLGNLVLLRSTKAEANRLDARKLANIGTSSLIAIDKKIVRPYETVDAIYRITLKGEARPETTFASDNRQQVVHAGGDSFELHVKARHRPPVTGADPKPGAEFLESNYFINSDDARVKQHAKLAVGDMEDPWEKAHRIEQYVYEKMDKKNFTEAFATADQVAKTLEGDCTEHGVLTAAMLRAVGIPSRTALGLVYVDTAKGPVFGFHMWAEAYVRGTWMPVDATMGRGFVGATHLKISDQSWHNTTSLTPLLPVMRVLGKMKIEVVRPQ